MPSPSDAAPLRTLSRHEAPFPGVLLAGERRLVWVDAAIWESHPAWCARPDGHVLAPVDAGRRDEGDGVLLPHCTLRVRDWIDGRLHIGDGEAVTLGVSILRGAVEAEGLSGGAGEWWLTDDGRPVLGLEAGTSTLPWREASVAVLGDLANVSSAPVARAVSALAEAISGPAPLTIVAAALEESLFGTAAPAPLATDVPLRARTTSIHRASAPAPSHDGRPRGNDLVSGFLDAEWADRLRDTARTLRARLRHRAAPAQSTRAHRRGAVFAAAAAAVAVLTIGLMWPEGSATSADPSSPTPTATTDESDLEASPSAAAADPPESSDLRSVAVDLLERFAECAAAGCPATVAERPDLRVSEGPLLAPRDERETELVDDYGGVAVLRVDAEGGSQLVVIVRTDESWLVRDVFDAADQP